jgi:hypothetical protein
MVSKATGTTALFKRKAQDEGHCTLGFHLAGNSKEGIQKYFRHRVAVKNASGSIKIHRLHEFQSRHLERLVAIEELHYNGQKCWAELARLYLYEAENRIIPVEHTIEQYLHGREGVG